jgi:hypothetical protein
MELICISEYFSIELLAVNAIFNLVCLNNLVMTFVSFTTYVNLTCFVVSFFFHGFWYYFIRFALMKGHELLWRIFSSIEIALFFLFFFWNTWSVCFCSGGWYELAGTIVSVVVGFLYVLNFNASISLAKLIPRTFVLLFSSWSYENNNFWNNVAESSTVSLYKRRFVIDYGNIIYVSKRDAEVFTTFYTAVMYKTLWRTRAFRE